MRQLIGSIRKENRLTSGSRGLSDVEREEEKENKEKEGRGE